MKNKQSSKKGPLPKKPFGAVEVKTVESDDWKKLNYMEAHVYNTMKTFYRGDNQWFQAPFESIKKRTRIKHGKTIDKTILGLEQKGWLEVTRYAKHGRGRGLRVKPNEYRLAFKHDFGRW